MWEECEEIEIRLVEIWEIEVGMVNENLLDLVIEFDVWMVVGIILFEILEDIEMFLSIW